MYIFLYKITIDFYSGIIFIGMAVIYTLILFGTVYLKVISNLSESLIGNDNVKPKMKSHNVDGTHLVC